jgi:hypothetical protein
MNTEKLSSENETSNGILGAVICCGSFEKYAKQFKWMILDQECEERKYIMPHINIIDEKYDTIKMRVNHCPTCGFEVRNIELSQERFDRCR